MPLKIIRNDITKVKADIIVNSANPKPVYANGTDAAIMKQQEKSSCLLKGRKLEKSLLEVLLLHLHFHLMQNILYTQLVQTGREEMLGNLVF